MELFITIIIIVLVCGAIKGHKSRRIKRAVENNDLHANKIINRR